MLAPEKVVLYAEDSPDDRFFMAEAWKEAGCERRLVMVEDGEQAVAYMSGAGVYADRGAYPLPGLVLLDLKMPKRTGLETLSWMRSTPVWKTVPVVLLTASAAPADVTAAYGGGANVFMVKPTTAKELAGVAAAIRAHWLQLVEYV